MAVFAPMPSASESTAIRLKALLRSSIRAPYLQIFQEVFHIVLPNTPDLKVGPTPRGYSWRSAMTGSTRVARSAGT